MPREPLYHLERRKALLGGNTSLEGKNQTKPTSLEGTETIPSLRFSRCQNQTIPTSLEELNHTIFTSLEGQNHTNLTSLEALNHTIYTSLEDQNHTILTSLEELNHTILKSLNSAKKLDHSKNLRLSRAKSDFQDFYLTS